MCILPSDDKWFLPCDLKWNVWGEKRKDAFWRVKDLKKRAIYLKPLVFARLHVPWQSWITGHVFFPLWTCEKSVEQITTCRWRRRVEISLVIKFIRHTWHQRRGIFDLFQCRIPVIFQNFIAEYFIFWLGIYPRNVPIWESRIGISVGENRVFAATWWDPNDGSLYYGLRILPNP